MPDSQPWVGEVEGRGFVVFDEYFQPSEFRYVRLWDAASAELVLFGRDAVRAKVRRIRDPEAQRKVTEQFLAWRKAHCPARSPDELSEAEQAAIAAKRARVREWVNNPSGRRHTQCWKCRAPLDSLNHAVHSTCNGLTCRCGACLCGVEVDVIAPWEPLDISAADALSQKHCADAQK